MCIHNIERSHMLSYYGPIQAPICSSTSKLDFYFTCSNSINILQRPFLTVSNAIKRIKVKQAKN